MTLTYTDVVRVVMDLVALRAAKWITLGVACGLYIFTIAQPSWERLWPRLVAASVFTLLIHMPLWWERKRKETHDVTS